MTRRPDQTEAWLREPDLRGHDCPPRRKCRHLVDPFILYPFNSVGYPRARDCQGFAVGYSGFTLGALDLRHPRLLQR
jgi:hypothetical protein